MIQRLYKNTTWLGGLDKCFTIEKKSRIFIDEVLKYVCSKFTQNSGVRDTPVIYTDMEVELKIFNETIMPDY